MSYIEFAAAVQAKLIDPITNVPLFNRRQTSGILSAALRAAPNALTAARNIARSFSRNGYLISPGDQNIVDFVEAGLLHNFPSTDIQYASYLLRAEVIHSDYLALLGAAIAPALVPNPVDFWNGVLPQDRRDHILDGHVYVVAATGLIRATGLHHARGTGRVTGIVRPPNGYEVYEATVEILDAGGRYVAKTNNHGTSTIFPDTWTQARVIADLYHGFLNRVPYAGGIGPGAWGGPAGAICRTWEGTSTTGYTIQGYELQAAPAIPFGLVRSGFPLY